jgi:glucose-1-phosphate cytidylyltransferase
MKTVILAGGLGTRISEETADKPKPMVLVDDKPIIWHVMDIYARQGFKDFVIATGYKSEVISNWVENEKNISLKELSIEILDTGLETQTAGRIKRSLEFIDEKEIMVTYGDGLGNVNINNLIQFHKSHGKIATVTAVRPPARFGFLHSENGIVTEFGEKNQADAGWINGGFFVLNQEVLSYLKNDSDPFEATSLPALVKEKSLMAFHHEGFWQPMDTLREKNELSRFSRQSIPPWIQGITE